MKDKAIGFEAMLAGWSETHSGGAKIVLWINSEDLEPFKAMTIRKGNHAGQRFMAALVEIGDDEEPRNSDRRAGPLLQSALVLCRDENFQDFAHVYSPPITQIPRDAHAANVLRKFCGVDSRKDLDGNDQASQMLSRLMTIYRGWMNSEGRQ